MNNQPEQSDYERFLENQVTPTKPTAKEIEWARKRFSSRAEPPKS